MRRMRVLVKVSGDLIEGDGRFYDWLSSAINPSDRLFILCGGGFAITDALNQYSIPFEFGPNGREIGSLKGKRVARQVLQAMKAIIVSSITKKRIEATVFTPVVEVGGEICHINGDSYAMALYPSFDKIFIVTLKGRVKKFPENLAKIQTVYL